MDRTSHGETSTNLGKIDIARSPTISTEAACTTHELSTFSRRQTRNTTHSTEATSHCDAHGDAMLVAATHTMSLNSDGLNLMLSRRRSRKTERWKQDEDADRDRNMTPDASPAAITNDSDGSMFSRQASCATVGDVSIRSEILRGVAVSRTLRKLGALWRVSPCDMEPARLGKVHGLASTCEDLDAFISHTWASPWWQKYVTLLMYIYWRPAAVVAAMTLLLFGALDVAGLLPATAVVSGFSEPFTLQRACWSVVPPALGLLVLLSGPYLHLGRCGDPNIFLDVVCINQVDANLRTEGISCLAGFLQKSKKMVVLWTPENTQRLWCVFEVAVFCKLNGHENIVWCPLFQYSTALLVFCCATLIEVVNAFRNAYAPNVSAMGSLAFGLAYILWVGLGVMVLHVGRAFMRSKADFLNALPGLECADAKCREACDRTFILESIRHWYGSEADFNKYLRCSVSRHIMQAVASMDVTYRLLIVCLFPRLCTSIERMIAYSRPGLLGPRLLVTDTLLDFCQPLFVIPACFKLTWQAMYIMRARWQHKVVDLATSTMAAAAFFLALELSWRLAASLRESVWCALAYTVCCVLLTLLTFHACAEMGLPAKAASDHRTSADVEGSGYHTEHADVEAPSEDADFFTI